MSQTCPFCAEQQAALTSLRVYLSAESARYVEAMEMRAEALRKLEAAEGRLSVLSAHATVIQAARDRIDLHENDVARQQVILRLSPNELGHLNELLSVLLGGDGGLSTSAHEPEKEQDLARGGTTGCS